jgi:hypothetical protein
MRRRIFYSNHRLLKQYVLLPKNYPWRLNYTIFKLQYKNQIFKYKEVSDIIAFQYFFYFRKGS